MTRLFVALILAVAVSVGAQGASAATGSGDLIDDSDHAAISVDVIVVATGTDSHSASDSNATAGYRPFVYEAVPNSSSGFSLEHLCNAANAPFDPNGGAVPWGWRYTVYKRDRATGALVGEPEEICVPLTDPASTTPPPPPELPQPPTLGEIWNAAALPRPEIAMSPDARGITGLETRMWAANPERDVAVSVNLRGFTVTGTARLVGYSFDFGEGPEVDAPAGGSAASPAARHTYETKGSYQIRVAALWRGEFEMTGPAITDPVPVDLRTAQLTSTRDYPVAEIRSMLTG
jgi:hypothetical protein